MQHMYDEYADRITVALTDAPGHTLCAYDLGKAVKLDSAVFYPVVHEMEDEGIITSTWDHSRRLRLYALKTNDLMLYEKPMTDETPEIKSPITAMEADRIVWRKGTTRRVDNPIRNLATDPVSADRVNQLIRDRNEMHGKLVIAQFALDMVVRDNERKVKELTQLIETQRKEIADQQREITRLKTIMFDRINRASDPLPAWHQPNPLPRAMR